jgi:hypothetical protein
MISKEIKGTASGIVEAPLIEVSDLLLDVRAGKVSGRELPVVLDGVAASVEIQGGPRKFTVLAGAGPAATRLCFIELDRANHSVSIYGGWWFRGEYTVGPHSKGCLLTYYLYNSATGVSGAIAGLLHRRELKTAAPALKHMLQKLGKRLGCAAYVTEPLMKSEERG